MKKRKGWIVILCIFLIAFGFEFNNFAKDFYIEYKETNWKEEFEKEYSNLTKEEKEERSLEEFSQASKTKILVFGVVFCTFISILFTIVRYIFLWSILIGVYLGLGKYYKKKLSKNDFMKNKEYYRDVLKEYSVDILSYIDNLKLSYPNVLISMLLQLKLKGVITIESDNIYVNEGVDLQSLSNTEKYFIKNIKNNKLFINNINEYEELVVTEGLNKDLLEKKEVSLEHIKKEMFASIVFYLIVLVGYILFWIYFPNSFTLNINNFAVIMVCFFFLSGIVFLPPIFIFYYPFYLRIKYGTYYIKIKSNPYFRTKTSEEINKKLEGLKSFLNDFSTLDEREAKEIVLWDEYLIYSVLFSHNSQIIDEYKDLITN